MFEPFHPKYVPICRNFKFRQYIQPNAKNTQLYKVTEKILSGNVRNIWIDRFNKKVNCRKRLIKDVRANLLLKWMHSNFTSIPIILMMRHPCAVAHSRLKRGWETHLDDLLKQKDLVDDFLKDTLDDIQNCKTEFDEHVYLWCIENYIPLVQFKKGEIYVVFYENLCSNPEEQLRDLFLWLEKPFEETITEKIRKPSKTSQSFSAIKTGESIIDNWKNQLSTKQIDSTMRILDHFGLDQVYDINPMPKVKDPIGLLEDR
ncbi:MAG: Sulfotransferase domain protein [Candidatus Scalindua rubra]|uniref:Sulfotransferase domain protein n=1 Tax=Candidatus Scalindua rubra TaxID=1872076 RepID=A0A1E3X266_9BACT|nr:MAG: Sulfotransferase domain protein [Candidatus Scalindua rubra]